MKAVKLSFSAPVHFGTGRLSSAAYTCDAATLFSALYLEALNLGMEEDLLAAAQSGELALSDEFPYSGETLYLPKPMVRLEPADESESRSDSRMKKASKKLKYVSRDKYRSFLSGDFDALEELEHFNSIGSSALRTRVNLTRESKNDAEPYHVGGFSFARDAGMYFLVQGGFDLRPLLDSLQFAGLGGKRSSGYGRFSYEIADGGFLEGLTAGGSNDKVFVLLSCAVPTREELTDELLAGARYALVRKSGFIQSVTHHASPQKKRDLYLFSSGSVFLRPFYGDIFDVNATPGSHPVYRYARALWAEV